MHGQACFESVSVLKTGVDLAVIATPMHSVADIVGECVEKKVGAVIISAGGVGVINVGAATETEMQEKKDRIDDALNATRAAVEEGIVPGGGVAYLRAMVVLEATELPGEEQFGVQLLKRALGAPVKQIAANAGFEGAVVFAHVMEGQGSFGFNAETGTYEDLMKAGIVDPTKVSRFALQNAASVAGLLMTTEAMIADKPKKGTSSVPALPPEDSY